MLVLKHSDWLKPFDQPIRLLKTSVASNYAHSHSQDFHCFKMFCNYKTKKNHKIINGNNFLTELSRDREKNILDRTIVGQQQGDQMANYIFQ